MLESHPARLSAEVRVLGPRHLVAIDVGRPGAHVGFERRVIAADDLPVARQRLQDVGVELRVELGPGQRRRHGAQVRLRGEAAHRVEGAVDRVGARVDRGQDTGGADAAGVVCVEVDGQPDLASQRLHQRAGRARPAHARHVLDAEDLRARLLELPGQVDVVAQVPLRAGGVEQIARVAHRRLAQRSGAAHGVDRDAHVVDSVQRVEDAEQIDARQLRLRDEMLHDVVGIARVADRVRGAHHHLEDQVGNRVAQPRQPLPRVLAQEPQHHVERRAAPALEREELRRQVGVRRGDGHDVVRPDPRRQERLLRVADRRVGEENALLTPHPAQKALGPELPQPIAAARWDRPIEVETGHRRRRQRSRGPRVSQQLRVTVDGDFAEELEETERATR